MGQTDKGILANYNATIGHHSPQFNQVCEFYKNNSTDQGLQLMNKEERKNSSRKSRPSDKFSTTNSKAAPTRARPSRKVSFTASLSENQNPTTKKYIKSFKRIGSKPTIPAFSSYVNEDQPALKSDPQAAPQKRQETKKPTLPVKENKKLKRIGKKVFLPAYSCTLVQKQQPTLLNNTTDTPITPLKEQPMEIQHVSKDQEKHILSSEGSILDSLSENNIQRSFGEKEKNVLSNLRKVSSQMDQLSIQRSSVLPGQLASSVNSIVLSDKDKSLKDSTKDILQKCIEAFPALLEYETYSISVNSHEAVSQPSTQANNRNSRKPSDIKLKDILSMISNKRDSVEPGSESDRQKRQQKQSKTYADSCRKESVKKSYASSSSNKSDLTSSQAKNYIPLPSAYPFTQQSSIKSIHEQKLVKAGKRFMDKGNQQEPKGVKTPGKQMPSLETPGKQMPSLEKIDTRLQNMHFLQPRTPKNRSQHLPSKNIDDKRAYLRNKENEQNPTIANSLKRSHRQLEVNKYIQEAKKELKSSLHY